MCTSCSRGRRHCFQRGSPLADKTLPDTCTDVKVHLGSKSIPTSTAIIRCCRSIRAEFPCSVTSVHSLPRTPASFVCVSTHRVRLCGQVRHRCSRRCPTRWTLRLITAKADIIATHCKKRKKTQTIRKHRMDILQSLTLIHPPALGTSRVTFILAAQRAAVAGAFNEVETRQS